MRNIKKQNRAFFGKLAEYYDFIFGNWIKNMQGRVVDIVDVKNNSKILDAGCGTGNLLVLLEKSGKNLGIHGIDISKEMIKIARRKTDNINLKIGLVENMDFKNNFFDYIFSIDAFHHYSDKDIAMNNFYRVLKKNGRLIIVDINFGRFFNVVFQKLEPGNSGIYTRDEMKNLFEDFSFKEIIQRRVGLFTYMTIGMK